MSKRKALAFTIANIVMTLVYAIIVKSYIDIQIRGPSTRIRNTSTVIQYDTNVPFTDKELKGLIRGGR